MPQRRPNFALNSPQPIVRLATIAAVHHKNAKANFVRIPDVSYWLFFRSSASQLLTLAFELKTTVQGS